MKKLIILNVCVLLTLIGCTTVPIELTTTEQSEEIDQTELVEEQKEESTGYQLYEDDIYKVSFEYPSDWVITMSNSEATYFASKDRNFSWDQGGINYYILDNPEGLVLQEYLDQEYEICLKESPANEVFGPFCFESNVSEWIPTVQDGHTFFQSPIYGVPESGEQAKDVYILKDMSHTPKFFIKMIFVYVRDMFFMDELSGHVLQSILFEDIEEVESLNTEEEYLNKYLGISFTYPGKWGEVDLDYEENVHASIGFSNFGVGLSLYTDGQPVARGASWGDKAIYIEDQAFVDNFCEVDQNHKFFLEKEKCEIRINSNNVKFAKVMEDTHTKLYQVEELGEIIKTTSYYIYNPNSEYRGIMISDYELRADKALGYEEILDEFVDSLQFVD